MFSLHGKTAFITGASGGIGLAVAKRYVAAGARVVLADINDGTAVARDLGSQFVRIDISKEDSMAQALGEAHASLGGLDIVVNNAGIGDVGPSLTATPQALIERLTGINHWGVIYGLKHAPPLMNDGGSIINTSSLAGVVNITGAGVYSAGKRAVISLTETAALELGARGIRVNAVCPGYVQTALGSGDEGRKMCEAFCALGRAASVDDLVGLYHFLASDDSAYLTGQAIRIDGGWSAGVTPQLLTLVIGSAESPA